MRKILLSSITTLLLALPFAAHSQSAVFCVNCSQYTAQVLNFAKEIANLEQQLQQQEQIYQNLTRQLDPNNLASGLTQFQNPFNANQLTTMFSQWHTTPMTYPGSSTFLSGNQVYQVPGSDFNATELNNNGIGVANMQSAMNAQIQSIASHIDGLETLRGQLSSVTTESDLTALNGRIQSESADIQAQGVQTQALQAQFATEQTLMQQRQLQATRQSDDELTNSPAFMSLGSTPNLGAAFVASN